MTQLDEESKKSNPGNCYGIALGYSGPAKSLENSRMNRNTNISTAKSMTFLLIRGACRLFGKS